MVPISIIAIIIGLLGAAIAVVALISAGVAHHAPAYHAYLQASAIVIAGGMIARAIERHDGMIRAVNSWAVHKEDRISCLV